ncbi:MAG TPA: peroxiredoxin [Candidatus Kryptonia bacterium]
MKLNTGEKAPDFKLPSTTLKVFHLYEELAGGNIILYFYPKDFTMGCTAEACGFRDEFSHLRDAGVRVVGVSTDTIESHERFRKEHNLPFELLSDAGGAVSKMYGAFNPIFKFASRVTFIIGKDGTLLKITKSILPRPHLDAAKKLEEKGE